MPPVFTRTIITTAEGKRIIVDDDTAEINRVLTEIYDNIETHKNQNDNPHSVTKNQVGLSNVDNTSDVDKPVSTEQAGALALKAPINNPIFTGTVSGVTKAMVGLGSADNTSDDSKPVSTPQATAISQAISQAGRASVREYGQVRRQFSDPADTVDPRVLIVDQRGSPLLTAPAIGFAPDWRRQFSDPTDRTGVSRATVDTLGYIMARWAADGTVIALARRQFSDPADSASLSGATVVIAANGIIIYAVSPAGAIIVPNLVGTAGVDFSLLKDNETQTTPGAPYLANGIVKTARDLEAWNPDYNLHTNSIYAASSWTWAEVVADWDALAAAAPDYVTRVTLVAADEAGYPLYAYKLEPAPIIADPADIDLDVFALPRFFATADHGTENPNMVGMRLFAESLIHHWQTDERLAALRWGARFVFIPHSNPYGVENNTKLNFDGYDPNDDGIDSDLSTQDPGPDGFNTIAATMLYNCMRPVGSQIAGNCSFTPMSETFDDSIMAVCHHNGAGNDAADGSLTGIDYALWMASCNPAMLPIMNEHGAHMKQWMLRESTPTESKLQNERMVYITSGGYGSVHRGFSLPASYTDGNGFTALGKRAMLLESVGTGSPWINNTAAARKYTVENYTNLYALALKRFWREQYSNSTAIIV